MTSLVWLTLPLPPSLNGYYENAQRKRKGGATYMGRMISEEGSRYRNTVLYEARQAKVQTVTGRLSFTGLVEEPDRSRNRDLDNFFKCLLDALTHAKVIKDDSHFDEILMRRGEIYPGGRIIVTISRFVPPEPGGLFDSR